MRNRLHILCITAAMAAGIEAYAQMPDTTGIYRDRTDSLDAAVSTGHAPGNYLSRGNGMRVEVVSADGLKKMAC